MYTENNKNKKNNNKKAIPIHTLKSNVNNVYFGVCIMGFYRYVYKNKKYYII